MCDMTGWGGYICAAAASGWRGNEHIYFVRDQRHSMVYCGDDLRSDRREALAAMEPAGDNC